LTGCISKGIALSGLGNIRDSNKAFDLAFTFANEDPNIIMFLLLIKACEIFLTHSCLHHGFQAIVIFNAGQHEEAIIRVQELAATCQNDTLACHIVEVRLNGSCIDIDHLNFGHQAYLRVQLVINAFDGGRYNEATGHFIAAVKMNIFSSRSAIHSRYDDFVVVR
jgi:hypothetical protein